MLKKSKFLAKADLATPLLLTIRGLQEENVAMADQPEEMEWCLLFEEQDKPMVLKPVNTALIAQFLGDETDNWIGKKVVLYYDPSIMFKGQLKGGLRVRQPRQAMAAAAPRAAAPVATKPSPVQPRAAAPVPVAEPEPDATAPTDDDCPF